MNGQVGGPSVGGVVPWRHAQLLGLARPGELLWLDCRDTTWSWMPLHIIVLALGGPVWLVPSCVALAALSTLRRPSQTLIDRLLGTWVVPR